MENNEMINNVAEEFATNAAENPVVTDSTFDQRHPVAYAIGVFSLLAATMTVVCYGVASALEGGKKLVNKIRTKRKAAKAQVETVTVEQED